MGCMRVCRVILALAAVVMGACASAPPPLPKAEPIPDQRPEDFVLAATVLAPREDPPALRDPDEDEAVRSERVRLPRSLRPARYIVEADGTLHAAVGRGASAETYPPQTRQLTPRQYDLLWRQLRGTNLLDPGNPARIEGPEGAKRAPDRTMALIYVGYEGKRITLRVLLDRGSEDAIAAERLVDRLAELAWVRE
jgi:hypothetical protein